MSSKIHFKEHEDYLLIKIMGYEEIINFFSSLKTAYELCKKKNISNIILDIYDVDFTQVNFMDRFLAGEKIAEYSKYPNALKVAVIGPKEHCDGFVDNVATNRGALFKVFYNENDAIKWIRE